MVATDGATGRAHDIYVKDSRVRYRENVMGPHMVEGSLLGVGTVLRVERDAWSMVK